MPPSIIYYVLKDIYEDLASSYHTYIKQERTRVAANTTSTQSDKE